MKLTRFCRKLSIGASLLAIAACGGETTSAAAPAEAASQTAEAITGDAPAMWRLADADSEIFLFGTFHILPADVQWTTDAFDAAMAATATTYTEADTQSPEAQAAMGALVQELGLNPQGVTLSSVLGPERSARFAEVAQRYGVPMAALEPYRPWLATLSLTVIAMQQAGFDPASGVEAVVLKRAGEENDAIAYFETAEFQVRALASLDGEEMLGNFDATMDQFDDFAALTNRMLTAWRTGDVATLEADIVGMLRNDAPGAFKTLIVDRNRDWTAQIKTLMAGEGDYFIAVGAGHLVGEDSVVDMLGDEGFKVERVQ